MFGLRLVRKKNYFLRLLISFQSPFHFDCDYDRVLEDMTVMSDSELHSLCKKEAALRHLKLPDDVITSSGKLKKLDGILPKLKEQVRSWSF